MATPTPAPASEDRRLRGWNWIPALARTVRDGLDEKRGRVVAARWRPEGDYLDSRVLGLLTDCNGSPGYVAYHGNFFTPDAYRRLDETGVAWLRVDELPRFIRDVLPRVERPFVLVTLQSDWTVPDDCRREADLLLASGKVRRWFTSNLKETGHPILTPMPIGMRYSLKQTIERTGRGPGDYFYSDPAVTPRRQDAIWRAAAAVPFAARELRAFGDFWLNNARGSRRFGESRADIQAQLAANPAVVLPPRRLPADEFFATYGRYAFVVSPHGRGYDCYRTWQALACGAIPIVKRSPLDVLYQGLPVVIVDDWSEIGLRQLEAWREQFGSAFDRTRVEEVLSLRGWRQRIGEAAGMAPGGG